LSTLKSETVPHRGGFSSRQQYRTTAERASRMLQVPTYVGEGRGTHRWDSIRTEYVEELRGGGDFIIVQRDIFDSTKNIQLKKSSITIDWELRGAPEKQGGILRDLSWEGMLFLEEHVDAEATSASSWVPGYLSLRAINNDSIPDAVPYADLSYRQEIGWTPSFNPSLSGRLAVTPDYRRIRSYRERGITGTLQFEQRGKRITAGSTLRYFTLVHDDTLSRSVAGNFRVRDASALFSQTLQLTQAFDLSLKERIGLARQDPLSGQFLPKPLDSTLYFQLTPGASWSSGERGRIDAAYTFSLLTLPAGLDYRIAGGFSSGISHLVTLHGNIRIHKNFSLNGSWRSEFFGESTADGFRPPAQHVISLEVAAFL
jgi:hypothetical protein